MIIYINSYKKKFSQKFHQEHFSIFQEDSPIFHSPQFSRTIGTLFYKVYTYYISISEKNIHIYLGLDISFIIPLSQHVNFLKYSYKKCIFQTWPIKNWRAWRHQHVIDHRPLQIPPKTFSQFQDDKGQWQWPAIFHQFPSTDNRIEKYFNPIYIYIVKFRKRKQSHNAQHVSIYHPSCSKP